MQTKYWKSSQVTIDESVVRSISTNLCSFQGVKIVKMSDSKLTIANTEHRPSRTRGGDFDDRCAPPFPCFERRLDGRHAFGVPGTICKNTVRRSQYLSGRHADVGGFYAFGAESSAVKPIARAAPAGRPNVSQR